MKTKLFAAGVSVLAVAAITGGAYLLPARAESSLNREAGTVHAQAPAADDTSIQLEAKDAGLEDPVKFTAAQLEPFQRLAQTELQSKLEVQLPDGIPVVFAQMDASGDLTITWASTEPADADPSDGLYFSTTIADADLITGTGTVTAVGASGSSFHSAVEGLQAAAVETFRSQFQVNPPDESSLYPMIDWVDGAKQIKLQWETYDYEKREFSIYEAVYEQVNQQNTEGTLVYLNHAKFAASGEPQQELTGQEIDALHQTAQAVAAELGYDITSFVDSYQYGGTFNFCFNINHAQFGQLNISLDTNGNLSGYAVGSNLLNHCRK